MITSHFFLKGKFRGSTTYTRDDIHDGLSPRARIGLISIAYLCPHCGELWARLFVESDEHHTMEWIAHLRECEKCGAGILLGTLTHRLSPSILATTYPNEFLTWDLSHRRPQS